METLIAWVIGGLLGLAFLTILPRFILGLVVIGEQQVGIVVKKFALKQLPPGRLVALNGEAGYQADTLGPGWHFGFFPWQYGVEKTKVIDIKAGDLGLLIARDGNPIPQNRILGKSVECDSFQDARKFLANGGEKGRQITVITAGKYRINTALFEIVFSKVTKIEGVGVVTTLDGIPIGEGEIAGQLVESHDNFQNAQGFIEAGGKRGLQEQVILSGNWNLNPWFVSVEEHDLTTIPIGHVGVVISYVGKAHQDISGENFKHGDLVERGHKGVWDQPLYPGMHPINPKTMKIEIVPTTNLALNWATSRSESHKLDEGLSSITVRSKDGFSFNLDVCQVIHIGATMASRVISRFGSMENLVSQVLEPAIGNYFRNSAQEHSVLEFLSARSERQKQASAHISTALKEYDVEAVDTLIGDINPPADLMKTQTERKLAEESKKTFEIQEIAQKQRQSLVREQSLADTQPQIVQAEREVNVTQLKSQSAINVAKGESEAMTLKAKGEGDLLRIKGQGEADAILKVGEAKAAAYKAGVEAMGAENYTLYQVMGVIGDKGVKLIPETLITGGGDDSSGNLVMTGMLASMFKDAQNRKTIEGKKV